MRLRKREPVTASIDEPVISEEGDELPRQLVDWTALPEELLLGKELRDELEHAVAALPANLRTVFVLRDIEGLSTAEVADALNLTEANVKVRLHRARLALRELLTAYFVASGHGRKGTDGNGKHDQEAYVRTLQR